MQRGACARAREPARSLRDQGGVDGEHVGYLPRGTAKRFNKRIRLLNEQGKRAICMAFIGRGGDHPNLGITLRIPYEGEILQGKR